MDSSDKNRIEGAIEEKKGEGKEKLGELRNDSDQQAEGQADQASGGVKKGIADLKDKVSGTVKKATD